jgi:hypothetical protein
VRALKNWMKLGCILSSALLVALAAGMEDNAVIYWNEKCKTLNDQGNNVEASDCWKKAIDELGNQTDAPIFTEIILYECAYRMDAFDKNNSTQVFSKICAEPISILKGQPNPGSEDVFLSFDVTNHDSSEMRIGNIYVDVIKYNQIYNPKIIQKFGVRKTIGNFCNIGPAIGSYKCKTLLDDDEYIYLPPKESEHLSINVNTDVQGIYQLRISLDYVIDGETHRIVVGQVPGMIGFFDRSMLPSQ